MSHSPTAQFGQGTGSGRRTMPTTKSALLESAVWVPLQNTTEGFVAKYEACLARRRPSVLPLDNLGVGAAYPARDGLYEYRAFANIRLFDLFPLGSARLFRFDRDCPHTYDPHS